MDVVVVEVGVVVVVKVGNMNVLVVMRIVHVAIVLVVI